MAKALWLLGILAAGAWASQTAAPPSREVAVIVTKEGYYPKNITVFAGEKVRFYVTSTDDAPDCVIVQGQKVFLAAAKGRITEGEAVFEHAGAYAFYCPSSKHDGKITVIPRNGQGGRGPASDPSAWVPKEYD